MNQFTNLLRLIPADLTNFLVVVLFALVIGLEQRRHHAEEGDMPVFGTDRTFTLTAMFGWVLYIIDSQRMLLFGLGAVIISGLLAIYYLQKIKMHFRFGVTSIIAMLITYSLAPLVYTQPRWLTLLVVVTVLVMVEAKKPLSDFARKFGNEEFVSLAKFLVVAGVILPLLPDKPLWTGSMITPQKAWTAVVVVSGISYLSYILQKFVFPGGGVWITSVLGGLYSSTATTLVLARRSKSAPDTTQVAGMMIATAMMYFRLWIIVLIFSAALAQKLLPAMLIMFVLSFALAWWKGLRLNGQHNAEPAGESINHNPLEFSTSLLFAILFILFVSLTAWVSAYVGEQAIPKLAFAVGFTAIDPFIISLMQSKTVGIATMAVAVMNATSSNNFIKMGYAIFLGNPTLRRDIIQVFLILTFAGLLLAYGLLAI